jgi:monofunctional biosynthetic peptidoglycan transglycosylase
MSAVAERASAKPGLFRRLWRFAWRTVVLVLLIVVALVPVYRFVNPVSTLMVYERLAGVPVGRTWVPLNEIAPSLIASALMAEDGRFCAHGGVDWEELATVIDENGDRPRGASTITMQTVKNLFLWQSRSYVRKAIEIPLALYANAVWGKPRTMELYLNVVDWGPGIFGAEAAARHYFGRSASELTRAQSALLAAALPNPDVRNPADPARSLSARAGRIGEMARASADYTGCLP